MHSLHARALPTLRDRRPGRSSAASSTSGRLVAASSSTPGRPSKPSSSGGRGTPGSMCGEEQSSNQQACAAQTQVALRVVRPLP